MSNDKTPENNELDPTVQAVVNALNDKSKFEASFIKQNLAEQTQVEEVKQVEELLDNEIVVDIIEEDGQIVGVENGVLFMEEDLPGIEYIEQFYGPEYVESAINEATQRKPATVNFMASQPGSKQQPSVVSQNARRAPAPARAPARGGASSTTNTRTRRTPASQRTERAAAQAPAPSPTASSVTQRARQGSLQNVLQAPEVSTADLTKATQQKVDADVQRMRDTAKPGEVKKAGFFSRLFRGKTATYTPGSMDTGTGEGFGKAVTDIATKIAQERKAPTAPPAATDGGRDVLDQLARDTAAAGGGATEGPTEGSAEAPATQTAGGRRRVPINFRIAGQAGTVERGEYKKGRESGEIESQEVTFNVRNAKTGERRTIRPGMPEYEQYKSRYKRMSQAVMEALIRMGAVLTEEGWMLGEELLESVYTEYAPVEMGSPYYYDSTGRLRIMTESEWLKLGLANVILEKAIAEAMDKMDEVGKEDEDVDNDGDSDKSDDYLHNRRKAIAAAIKEKGKK